MRRSTGSSWFLLAGFLNTVALLPANAAARSAPSTQTQLDVVWVFAATVLVFLMQGGFALLGAGALRGKNTVNYLTKSVMDFGFGALAFFAVGFGLMFGGSGLASGLGHGNPIAGLSGFFLAGEAASSDTLLLFLFQVMFAATAATIVAGAVAERMRLKAYVFYSIAITAIIYPVFGHWVWGGGVLASLPFGAGAVDFAGSGVVHAVGGLLALVAAWLVGPRLGRYDEEGRAQPLPGHNMTYVVLGTLLLFFGWFGFNAGSTLTSSDPRIARIAVNTFLAGCAGGVTVFALQALRGPTDIGTVCNGMLSGLVAVTAGCAFVAPWAALVIGAIGGVVYLAGSALLVHRLRVDDPVGAIPVHGFNGIVGLIMVGVFADGTGGVYGLVAGETAQLVAQLVTIGVLLVWTLGAGYGLFKTLDLTLGLRVDEAVERSGLDVHDHGAPAYPELAAMLTSMVGGKGRP